MARGLRELIFSKNWKSANDFPTYEDNEEKVRADIQLLYDEIRNYVNTVLLPAVNVIKASEIETSTTDVSVQSKLNSLTDAINNVTLGQIPDDSLTSEKVEPGGLLEDVTSQLTFSAQDTSGHPCDVSALQFYFSRALGMMFVVGRANFTRTAGKVGFFARYTITGPFDFGYYGSVFQAYSDGIGSPRCDFSPLGDYAGMDIYVNSAPDSEDNVGVDISGWFFCKEASS